MPDYHETQARMDRELGDGRGTPATASVAVPAADLHASDAVRDRAPTPTSAPTSRNRTSRRPSVAFLFGGIVNFFIPSGGGQWAVQRPIFIEAAQTIGTDPSRVVMGVAYGDQWSNMIQPFWTIPLLAVAGLHMRRVLATPSWSSW